jgi:tRNA threonylcarbamoyladenosine biosynthesis protein TsaE
MEIGPFGLDELELVGKKIIREFPDMKIWLFEGEMGAGKTTLIKQICKDLGVIDKVTSPTFSIINEYQTVEGDTIYHFDFYRLKHESEALDIGADEYFSSGSLCLLEWPSKITSLIPSAHLEINISIIEENKRKIIIQKIN